MINEKKKQSLVVVNDYQLSLAIGKEGQNARLAARLTSWKIDIKSKEDFDTMSQEDIDQILGLVDDEEESSENNEEALTDDNLEEASEESLANLDDDQIEEVTDEDYELNNQEDLSEDEK